MRLRLWGAAGVLAMLSGCAAQMLHRSGMDLLGDGKPEAGLAALARAVQAAPQDVEIRKDFYTSKFTVVSRFLAAAQAHQERGDAAAAQAELAKVLELDPANVQARQGLYRLRRGQQHEQALATARTALRDGDSERALSMVNMVLAEEPGHGAAKVLKRDVEEPLFREHFQEISLKDAQSKPINLDFRDVSVRMVLEALSQISGISFLVDKEIAADLRTTVVLKNAEIDEVVNLILRNNQLRSKVLNKKTVQVYPDTVEKRKEYQELVVRAFYLQDASAAQIQSVLKGLLRMKDIVIDERLNLVTVRDTPEAVRLAERLVALHDLAEPEVMLELEVLEVQREDLLKLGVQWPNQLGVIPLGAGGSVLTIDDLRNLNSSKLGLSFTNPSVSLRQDVGVSNLLANPRIRVHNREKASILIGDKVPVITTTSTATGFVAENVQYLDVGLKLAAEPLIHPSDDVSLRLSLEVSSIASQVSTPNGTLAYQVGTRNASTFLRLHNGETQVLAGLISDQDRRSASGIPGLSKLPIIGRLFSAPSDSRSKTEIVLSVTPRVVRSVARPQAQAVEFWSGTENGLSVRPLRLSAEPRPAADAGAAPLRADGAAPKAAEPPQYLWSGPNQVRAGEDFTLSLRVKASGSPAPVQLLYDRAAFELVETIPAAAAGALPDGGAGRLDLNLAQAMNGSAEIDATLLTLKLKAKASSGAAALQVVGAGNAAGAALSAYRVTIAP
ncbi:MULTISPECIES: secretin N-terminal domain-containing protein [unclassified Janthinobacterium]|uniref:secretin N-terminal domain-containing protein n=1 Tax=unclassified Janthinobacterium TaxID=2610881 RepID=UPI00034599DE|nr:MULTISPECIES: secretin N-terminal domain-containing protein [unclassified Janthinobacterium]MEC5159551.1 general secretion pathway protein D [Janthinobacterium sp. CG_S6]